VILQFEEPLFLFALFTLPFIVFSHFYTLKDKKKKAMEFANFETLKRLTSSFVFPKNIPQLIMRLIFIILIVLAFSGFSIGYTITGTDYNIIFNIDSSGSMLAKDLAPTRFESVKKGIAGFINDFKSGGNVGVVSFGGYSLIEQPLTKDFDKAVSSIDSMIISTTPGTAIGDSIRTSVMVFSSLDPDDERANMIILLTDGQENILTEEELLSIAEYAHDMNVFINILGVGSKEGSESEILESQDTHFTLNEEVLSQIAEVTEGEYRNLITINTLDEDIQSFIKPREVTRTFSLSLILFTLAIILLFIEWNFSNFHFRTFP